MLGAGGGAPPSEAFRCLPLSPPPKIVEDRGRNETAKKERRAFPVNVAVVLLRKGKEEKEEKKER